MSNTIDFNQLKNRATGRWQTILTSLGIPVSSLINRHQPCPCCGGRDRFRFDDKEGSGSFICTHFGNGGGNGFQLIQHWFNCDFRTALKTVSEVLVGVQSNDALVVREPVASNRAERNHSKALEAIWSETTVKDDKAIIPTYLQHRGLDWGSIKSFNHEILRLSASLPYWDREEEQSVMLGRFPAIVAKITGLQGDLKGLHLTYLQEIGGAVTKLSILNKEGILLPAKKMRSCFAGSLKGGVIQLYPCTDQLAVCEGIETAFAIHETSKLPVWACLSAYGLQSLMLPNSVKKLFIYCDNDLHSQGFRAGHNLMVRAIKSGIKAHIWQPKQLGMDALDVLVASKQGGVA